MSNTIDEILEAIKGQQRVSIIMRGLPGSGKTTLAKHIHTDKQLIFRGSHCLASADSFFMDRGEYRFDASKLSDAHNYSFNTAHDAMSTREHTLVIVDNTNITRAEYTPYVALSRMFGYKTVLVHVDAPVQLCVDRNTHGVPAAAIERMAKNFEKSAPFDPKQFTIAAV